MTPSSPTQRRARSSIFVAAALALAVSGPAISSFVYSYQDVDFTLDQLNPNAFTLRIQGALNAATGDWTNATRLDALGFKNLGIDFKAAGVSASLSSDTPGSTWTYVQSEIGASGCKTPNGQTGVICFDAVQPLAITDDMLFTVNITGASLNIDLATGPHLKLLFLDRNGNKAGSLLSKNMYRELDPGIDAGPGIDPIPAPAPLALIGLGVALLGLGRRRLAN